MSPELVSEKTILIEGVGATGSAAAISAVHTGFRVIKIIDNDKVEEHNGENQCYTSEDVGLPKVVALAKHLRKIDPNVTKIPLYKTIQEATDEELKADVYLSCFDNFGARFWSNMQANIRNIPMIDVGIDSFRITLRTVIPGKTPCLECWPTLIPETDLRASCSEKKIPSIFSTAQVAAGLQITELLKLIHGWEISPYQYFDLKSGKFQQLDIQLNPECPLCAQQWHIDSELEKKEVK